MGTRHVFSRQLVEGGGQALGQATAVHEEDGGAVGTDQLEQARVDGRPDRSPREGAGRAFHAFAGLRGKGLAHLREVLDRHLDPQVEGLARARVHDGHGPRRHRPLALGPAQEKRDLVEGTGGGGQAYALRRPLDELGESLEGEGQVGPALGAHEDVDLVHDHGVHGSKTGARLRSEEQEKRLRGRDQDLGGMAQHARAFVGRGVSGPDAGGGKTVHVASPGRGAGDAREGRAKVALDVDRQGLQG